MRPTTNYSNRASSFHLLSSPSPPPSLTTTTTTSTTGDAIEIVASSTGRKRQWRRRTRSSDEDEFDDSATNNTIEDEFDDSATANRAKMKRTVRSRMGMGTTTGKSTSFHRDANNEIALITSYDLLRGRNSGCAPLFLNCSLSDLCWRNWRQSCWPTPALGGHGGGELRSGSRLSPWRRRTGVRTSDGSSQIIVGIGRFPLGFNRNVLPLSIAS